MYCKKYKEYGKWAGEGPTIHMFEEKEHYQKTANVREGKNPTNVVREDGED